MERGLFARKVVVCCMCNTAAAAATTASTAAGVVGFVCVFFFSSCIFVNVLRSQFCRCKMFRANRAYDLHEEEVESAATKPEMYVEIELVHTKNKREGEKERKSTNERRREHDKPKEETRQEH